MDREDAVFFTGLAKYTFLGYILSITGLSLLNTAGLISIPSEMIGAAGFFTGILGVYAALNLTVLKESSIWKKLVYPLLSVIGFPVVFLAGIWGFIVMHKK